MNVVVYCSACDDLAPEVTAMAQALGTWIGQKGHSLVYGGVKAGLMHVTALAAQQAGATTIVGIVPACFEHRADPLCSTLLLSANLSERKSMLIERGDVFVVLPGGLGTIDEWISTLSQQVVDGKVKPIVVVNHGGMYDGVLQQLNATAQSPFARSPLIKASRVVTNERELLEKLNNI